jgi:hypothetical protein
VPQSRSGRGSEEKNSQPPPGIESHPVQVVKELGFPVLKVANVIHAS